MLENPNSNANCHLTELSFCSDKIDSLEQMKEFFDAAENCTGLQQLQVHTYSPLSFASIVRMVEKTTTLQELRIVASQTTTSLVGLAEALKHNTSLKYIDVDVSAKSSAQAEELHAATLQEFHTTLKDHNFFLQELNIQHRDGTEGDPRLREEIQFYLSLNKMGRNRLLAPGDTTIKASTDEWLEAIADQDDPSYIYYFLSNNPSLCLPDPINCCSSQFKASKSKKRNKVDSAAEAPFVSKKRRIHSSKTTTTTNATESSGVIGILTEATNAVIRTLEQNPTKISLEEVVAFQRATGMLAKRFQVFIAPSQNDSSMVTPNK